MTDSTARGLHEVRAKQLDAARQLGELIAVHERLRVERTRLDDHDDVELKQDEHDVEVDGDLDGNDDDFRAAIHDHQPVHDDDLTRGDRSAYIEAMRSTLYRLLYIVDFTLARGLIDRYMLRDARQATLDAIDTADACMMLDLPPADV